MKKKLITILTTVLIILTIINVVMATISMRANSAAAESYGERHAIISAIYESSIAGGAFTRLARYYSITGDEATYEQFFAELELDRYGQTQAVFIAYGAHDYEIELFQNVTDLRMQMLDIHKEVLRLRREGYAQEAIDLAHGPELQSLGIPAGPMSDEARDLVYERTTNTALTNQRTAEITGNLAIATSILILCGSIFLLIFAGKAGMPRRVDAFALFMLLLACAALIFSVLAGTSAEERHNAYQQQYELINASYNAERGGEILTRMSRMFVVSGNETQFNSYFAELENDRFGHALEYYILMNAKSSEINMLVDILGRLTVLRQIEAQSILLRTTGYYQEAIQTAFGADVAELDSPLAILGEELREAVNNRTQMTIDSEAHYYSIFATAFFIITVVFIIAGALNLLAIKHTGEDAVPGIAARAYRRIESAAIRTKLFASFSIVILFFSVQVGIDASFDFQINNLNYHKIHYMLERSDTIWAFHQEFTEMRRLLRATFLNDSWVESANEAEWLLAEQNLSSSYATISHLKEIYEASVRADPINILVYQDSRIVIIEEIMSHIDMIYKVYSENFNIPGNVDIDPVNVMDYTGPAEVLLQHLRHFIDVNRDEAERRIIELQDYSTIVTFTSLAAAFIIALLLAFSMLRTFTDRIKVIEKTAERVAQGDFDSNLLAGTDEITAAYSKLLEVFTELIDEINQVADEGRKGNTSARIDSGHYQGKHKETVLAINALLDTAEELLRQRELSQVAQKASEEKSKFLARMSHELRTPITAVLGISEIYLRSGTLPDNMVEAFNRIHDSARTLLNTVNDILDFSKIEAGKMILLAEEYDVAKLIGHATQMHTVYVEHKAVNLKVYVDEQLPVRLIGDTLRIRQIMNNLVSNALKYTEAGSVTLSFECGEKHGGFIDLVIIVEDTGFGMSESQLEVIKTSEYSRFYESNTIIGTGLGIPIVYSLTQAMNGQVDFRSEPGKGTTVHISIPQEICTAETLGEETKLRLQNYESYSLQSEDRFKLKAEPMPYGKVLVVDDVDANLFVAKGLLAFYGISVETCTNGQDAIRKIEQGLVYDIVFMDIFMPEQNGTEVMAVMRNKGYEAPIIALTANALVGQAEEYISSGFDDVISKPINSKKLNEVLVRFIRDKQPPEVIAAAREGSESTDNDVDSFLADTSVIDKLRVDFARNHKKDIDDIKHALDTKDIETAHRMVHTIKSSSGLINENTLTQIAQDAEDSLKGGKALTEAQLSALENELTHVLNNIEIPEPAYGSGNMSKDEINELLDKLEPLLETNNAKSVELIEELRSVQEAAILVRQMDNFDFNSAIKSMETLRLIYAD
ncbi:MAG: ATP-binding protein [Oscillospiraceae bacterium]|nr:ATP-binding protein [Oscillospiraceae bacterium]